MSQKTVTELTIEEANEELASIGRKVNNPERWDEIIHELRIRAHMISITIDKNEVRDKLGDKLKLTGKSIVPVRMY